MRIFCLCFLFVVVGSISFADTRNVVPNADGEGSIGVDTNRWGNGYFDFVFGDGSGLTGISGGGTTNLFDGPGTTGLVTSVSSDTNKYLKGDGTWGAPAGSGDFLADGTVAMTGPLNFGGYKGANVADGTVSNDVASLWQVWNATNTLWNTVLGYGFITNMTFTDWATDYPADYADYTNTKALATAAYPSSNPSNFISNADEEDKVFTNWLAVTANVLNWDTAYGWGDHSTNGYAYSSVVATQVWDFAQYPLALTNPAEFATSAQGVDGSTAYGWGNHATNGYAFSSVVGTQIWDYAQYPLALTNSAEFATAAQGVDGSTAFGWGNHATNGYAFSSIVATQVWDYTQYPLALTNALAFATAAQGASAATAFGWGDHSTNGYLLPASTNNIITNIVYAAQDGITRDGATMNLGTNLFSGGGGGVTSVASRTGDVVIVSSDLADFQSAVSTNADVVANTGKLSYPTADSNKLAGISAGATSNSTDAVLLARANHTGTQTASTISDFQSALTNFPANDTTTTNMTQAVTVASNLTVSGTIIGDTIVSRDGSQTLDLSLGRWNIFSSYTALNVRDSTLNYTNGELTVVRIEWGETPQLHSNWIVDTQSAGTSNSVIANTAFVQEAVAGISGITAATVTNITRDSWSEAYTITAVSGTATVSRSYSDVYYNSFVTLSTAETAFAIDTSTFPTNGDSAFSWTIKPNGFTYSADYTCIDSGTWTTVTDAWDTNAYNKLIFERAPYETIFYVWGRPL